MSNILEVLVNSHEPHRTFPDVAAHEGVTMGPNAVGLFTYKIRAHVVENPQTLAL